MKTNYRFRLILVLVIILINGMIPISFAGTFTYTNELDGDAVYRTGAWTHGHAGVYFNDDGTHMAYEIPGSNCSVELNTMNEFITNSETYIDAYYNTGVNQTWERDNIIATCEALESDDTISYIWYDIIEESPNSGTYLQVNEIEKIRCDGVVEYAYEWNNFNVWGKSDTGTSQGNPIHHDISYVLYIDEHNNLGKDQPWIETSPYVQRGASNTKWTTLQLR